MAMGLFATAIAGYKMTLSRKASQGDILSVSVELSLWNRLEELVGIQGACMPCLKAPAERILHRIGILATSVGLTKPSFVTTVADDHSVGRVPSSVGNRPVDSIHRYEEDESSKRGASAGHSSTVEVDRQVP
jgi:hypothetical protein